MIQYDFLMLKELIQIIILTSKEEYIMPLDNMGWTVWNS